MAAPSSRGLALGLYAAFLGGGLALFAAAACSPGSRASVGPTSAGTGGAASSVSTSGAATTSSTTSSATSGAGTGGSTVLPDAGTGGTGPLVTTVSVHYPVPSGHALTLRGSAGALNWNQGAPLTPHVEGDGGLDDVWTTSLTLSAPIAVKPLYDDQTWAIGPNWTITPGVAVDIWPHFFTQNGTITEIDGVYSATLNDARTVWVYLPPSAAENAEERFPVAYFQDGQNDFYDNLSYSGTAWDLQGAMDQGALDGTIHEAILIGIANDANRIWEYTPTPGGMDGGGASEYLTFVATELKPQMDARFPTEPDRTHTALCGSSLGGLVSIYGGLTRAEIFGLIGALSPSTWWDDEWILGQVQGSAGPPLGPLRVYLDSGNAGVFAQPDPWPPQANYDDWTQTAQLAQAYEQTGVPFDYLVQDGGQHSEVYWRQRVPGTLAFLFGPR